MNIYRNQTLAELLPLVTAADTQDIPAEVTRRVADIIRTVREKGDTALHDFSAQFDGVTLADLQVPADVIQAAHAAISPQVADALRAAAQNIRSFHEQETLTSFDDTQIAGVRRGSKITPLNAVGVYVPGGTAAYPSSVLMNVIPAKIAGVPKIVMVTPPQTDGIDPAVLVAADLAGVDAIYQVGGAQAIAALAYGTETIPKVDKITGPGNAYVAAAKRQVYGQVAIDMIAGPSEIGILADASANPTLIAADLLSQAEHDPLARTLLVTNDESLVSAVQIALDEQLATLPRAAIARQALAARGTIVVMTTVDDMIAMMNILAPEHLEIQMVAAEAVFEKITNAGSVFIGHYTAEPLGDYFAGPNHILPTGGTARFSSALGVTDFQKRIQYINYDYQALTRDGAFVTALARQEGLEAHARAIDWRLKLGENNANCNH